MGPPFNLQDGGGLEFLSLTNYLFQSGKFQILLHVYIEQFIKVNYLFHADSARNDLFQKYSSPPPED